MPDRIDDLFARFCGGGDAIDVEEFTITRNGRPVASLVPYVEPPGYLCAGCGWRGSSDAFLPGKGPCECPVCGALDVSRG